MPNIYNLAKLSGLHIQEETKKIFENSITEVSIMMEVLESIPCDSIDYSHVTGNTLEPQQIDMLHKNQDKDILIEDGYFLAPKVIKG